MASNIKEPELSPLKALESIRHRLEQAVEEGKKKAGLIPKTEAVFESYGDGDEYDDDIASILGDDFSNEPETGTENNDVQAKEEPAAKSTPTPAPAQKTATKPSVRRLAKTEREELERRAREYEEQRNAEWNFTKADIATAMKSLFAYADENREYLKGAGSLITELELRAIFFGEYRNYSGKTNLRASTQTAIDGLSAILSEKMEWLLKRVDERLHGIGDFLRNGSLMDYLLGASHKANVVRTATLEPSSKLGIRDKDVNNVLSQFILQQDLDECMEWIRNRFNGYDVTNDWIKGLALDILTNGTNKPGLDTKLGGRGSLKGKYATPRFGGLIRRGDDVVVIGPEEFVQKFNENFDNYMDASDKSVDYVGAKIEPIHKVGPRTFRSGTYGAAYNEKKYLPIIRELTADFVPTEHRIIPIAFNAGVTSIDSLNAAKGDNKGSRAGEALTEKRTYDGMSEINANVGEQYASNKLLSLMNSPSAKKLAELSDSKDELVSAIKDGTVEMGNLAKFSAKVLKWLGDKIGAPCSVKEVNGVPMVVFAGDKSIVAKAGASFDLDTGTRAVIRALVNYNNALNVHFKNVESGDDVSDIPKMSKFEIQSKATPDINLGELAEKCYDALYRKYVNDSPDGANSDPLVLFGKAYLVYSMGSLFNVQTDAPSLISDVKRYSELTGTPVYNVGIIRRNLIKMSPLDVVNLANRLDEAAPSIPVGQENGHDVYGEFYRDTVVSLNQLGKSGILGAMAYIINSEQSSMDVKECMQYIYAAIETLSGLEPGTLDKFMGDLATCDDPAKIQDAIRTIKKSGKGIVDIHLSDSGKETVKRVEVKPATAPKAQPQFSRPKMIGRNRF